jgi:hypothetical protein
MTDTTYGVESPDPVIGQTRHMAFGSPGPVIGQTRHDLSDDRTWTSNAICRVCPMTGPGLPMAYVVSVL